MKSTARFVSSAGQSGGESGKVLTKLLGLIVVVVLLAIGSTFFLKEVPPGYFGIRQFYVGPSKGYSNSGEQPGLHFTFPFVSDIHLVSAGIRKLNFNDSDKGSIGTLKVTTDEGNYVLVQATILYRILSEPLEGEPSGGPDELVRNLSLDEARWQEQVQNEAENELLRGLQELTASNFYVPEARDLQRSLAEERIREKLKPFGIFVEGVLIRYFTYEKDKIDEAINLKNIQVLEEELKQVRTEFAEQSIELERVKANTEAKAQEVVADGEAQSRKILAKAERNSTEIEAEADLLVARAQAAVEKKKADALRESEGAAVLVAKEMAPLLATLRGGVVAGLDPYDIKAWAERLGVSENAHTAANNGQAQ